MPGDVVHKYVGTNYVHYYYVLNNKALQRRKERIISSLFRTRSDVEIQGLLM